MNNFSYHVYTDVRFGKDQINALPELIAPLGKKVLLVYGGGSIKKNGIYGKVILPEEQIIMEIKTLGAVPLWVAEILCKLEIYPTSFSKYGTAFADMINSKTISIPHGGIIYA